MIRAKERFEAAILRIRNIHSLYSHLVNNLKIPESEVSHLLRSEIMYAVSCFDKFIHDIVKQGMVDTFLTTRRQTNSYKKFAISLEELNSINNPTLFPPPQTIFENIISDRHKHLSFQDPKKVADALSLIWDEAHKWQKIATEMGVNQNDIKVELKNIVIRRNQIVHENDVNLLTNNLEPIKELDTKKSVDFIEMLGLSIYELVK